MKRWVIRTRKSDSAVFYHLLEAHEGLAIFSTVNDISSTSRDVEVWVPIEQEFEFRSWLESVSSWVQVCSEPSCDKNLA